MAAALGLRLARNGTRVLIVELSRDRSLAALFGKIELGLEPTRLVARLHGVRVETQPLVEAYFSRLLRLPFLTRRLFASPTFNALTAAAPGVTEFLILDHLLQWLEPTLFKRSPYDMIIVDAPATGHALQLLRTPRTLTNMVPGGPIGSTARKLLGLLVDSGRTGVMLVTLPDEMAVNETIETKTMLTDNLALNVCRPILNRVAPRRFRRDERGTVLQLADEHPGDELLATARLQISRRAEAERHLGRLRRAFGCVPIAVPHVCCDSLEQHHLESIGRVLDRGLHLRNGRGE